MAQRALWLLSLSLIVALPALAEDAKARAAREELERQLNQMVGKAPTRVRIDYASLDEPNYQLEEASFELDGRGLGTPSLGQLQREGDHLIWSGDVAPGKHTVKVLLVYANATSIVVSDEGGYKWRVGGAVSFDVHAGIEVRVTVTPSRDGSQPDIAKRFKLALPAKPVMLAELDDGKMPEPPPKPAVLVPVVDAGLPAPPLLVAADDPAKTKAEQAAELKRLAAEEARRKAEEAAEVKRLAAEERKRKAAEAAEAKRLAAEEKKRKAAEAAEARKRKASEAAEAKRLALEEQKRKAAEAAEARRLAAEEKKREALAAAEAARLERECKKTGTCGTPVAMVAADPASNPLDAGTSAVAEAPAPADAGAESFDAGETAIVRVEPDAGGPVAVAPPTVTPESEGPPWLLLGIGGGVTALIVLVVLARRSARPPTLDD